MITNNYTDIPKTFEDIELESMILHKLKGKVTKKIIIDIYESCISENQNLDKFKLRTKLLIKLLSD